MILQLLPLLRGWGWVTKDIDAPFTVKAGTEKVIEEAEREGWIIAAMCKFDNPYAELVFTYYDLRGGWVSTDMMPFGLKEAGLTVPNPTGVWCSRYDDANRVYVVVYGGGLFPIPFQRKYRISVRAPPIADVTVGGYSHVLVEIVNKNEFIKSLHEVLGTWPQSGF